MKKKSQRNERKEDGKMGKREREKESEREG